MEMVREVGRLRASGHCGQNASPKPVECSRIVRIRFPAEHATSVLASEFFRWLCAYIIIAIPLFPLPSFGSGSTSYTPSGFAFATWLDRPSLDRRSCHLSMLNRSKFGHAHSRRRRFNRARRYTRANLFHVSQGAGMRYLASHGQHAGSILLHGGLLTGLACRCTGAWLRVVQFDG